MKKFLTAFLTLIMLVVCCFSMTACKKKDFVEVDITFNVGSEEVTISYTLYGHLAEKSVEQFKDLADDGYYNGAVMYASANLEQGARLIGKYYFEDGVLKMHDEVETIKGEFAKGGTTGSDLKANKGNLCVFRWWDANSNLKNSGYGTGSLGNLIIPTSTGYADDQNDSTLVAVFGAVDEDSASALSDIISDSDTWKSGNYDYYHVFYYEDNGELKLVILNNDDYEAKVKDGLYVVSESDGAKETVEIFNPKDYEGSNNDYKSAKYMEDTISIPKDGRITIKGISIK